MASNVPKQRQVITLSLNESSRNGYRQGLARVFLNEAPGSETQTTEYIYIVEIDSKSERKVYLIHPAYLNNGFDFTIHVENQVFIHGNRRDDIPAHPHIYDDLLAKKTENPALFKQMKSLLDKVFFCNPIQDTEYGIYPFSSGIPVELLFKTIKWLFIEQDITYWNYEGRGRLYKFLSSLWEPTLWEQE